MTLLLLTLLLADAGVPPAKGRIAVDFVASDRDQAWIAGALDLTLERELTRFEQVSVVPNVPAATCPKRETDCLLDAYVDADIVIVGTLAHGTLRYETYETWTRSLVSSGRVTTTGALSNVDELVARMGHIVRPIVQTGGALDSRPVVGAAARTRNAEASRLAAQAILGALILLLLSPMAILRWLVRDPAKPRSRKWSFLLAAACAAVLAVISIPAAREIFALVPQAAARVGLERLLALAPPLAGGILWGALVLVAVRIVGPRLHGVERIRHEALAPLLRAWLQVALVRAVLVGLAMVPIFSLAGLATAAMGLERSLGWMLVTPIAGLLAWFWFLALVDHLAIYLDHSLIDAAPFGSDDWHRTTARYFRGYVRRSGLDLEPSVVERFLFLPSKDLITCYGGGFASPRVLVSADAREGALGSLPDEVEMPERTVNPEELPFGLLLPESEEKKSKKPREEQAEALRRRAGVAPARGRAVIPRSIGENATLLGWVMPQAQDAGLPLISDSVEDFDVVRELLTMHYAGFEKNLEEGEYDDTDPAQKDFLYGALLREVGRCLRGESLFETVRLAFALQAEKMSKPTRAAARLVGAFYSRFFAGDSARVADAYTVLNGARDHLIQHLFRESENVVDFDYTARAPAPRLYERSKTIIETVMRRPPRGAETQAFRDTRRNRLLWLSEYLHASFPEPEGHRARRLRLTAVVAVASLAFAGLAIKSAIEYRPLYEERIRDMERRVAEEKAEEEAERNAGGAPDGGASPTK